MTAMAHPTGAMHEALGAYLDIQIKAVAGIGSSECLKQWPTPTYALKLAKNRVVLALIRVGEPAKKTRIGGPVQARITPSTAPNATARYDWDQVEQGYSLGMWAMSQGLRDDVDQELHRILNRAYWDTVTSIVTANLAVVSYQAIDVRGRPTGFIVPKLEAPGRVRVYAADLTGILPGTILKFTSARVIETEIATVDGLAIDGLGRGCFDVTLAQTKTAAVTLAEVPARFRRASEGLCIRLPRHFNGVARFDFDEPMSLDDMHDGGNAQTAEWRGVRSGIGATRHYTEQQIALQQRLNVTRTVSDPVPDTKTVVVF